MSQQGTQRFESSRGRIAGVTLDRAAPVVLVEAERGFELARLEGGQLARHAPIPGTPTGEMVVLRGTVFLTTSGEGASLVSSGLGTTSAEKIAPVSTPFVAVTRRGELVFTQGDQIALLSATGLRALLELAGADVEIEMEIDDRRRGVVSSRVRNPLAVIGRVAMTCSMAVTNDGIVYATSGDTIFTDALRFVSREGGLPRVVFAVADREDPARGTIGTQLGPIAASGGRIAVVTASSTLLGGRFGGELMLLDARDGTVLERTPIASSAPTAIAMHGDRVVIARRVDADEVIELWTPGATAWKHVARRRGRGLVMHEDLLWLGDGDALVRIDLSLALAAPSAKVTQLVEQIRKAEGRYETTTFQGKPAIKITAADGSRSIKPVTDAELAEIEALVRAS